MSRNPQETGREIDFISSKELGSLLAQKGIGVDIDQKDNQLILSVMYAGFTRRITIGKSQPARIITDPEVIKQIMGPEGSSNPLLAIVEANGSISISELVQQPPNGVSTSEFIKPREDQKLEVTTDVASVESAARTQLQAQGFFQFIHLPELSLPPGLDIDGKYLVMMRSDGQLEWFFPKAIKLKRTFLGQVLKDRGMTSTQDQEKATASILETPLVFNKSDELDPLTKLLESSNPDVTRFLQQVINENKTNSSSDMNVETIRRIKRRVLINIGLQRLGNPSIDQAIQLLLPESRLEVAELEEKALIETLQPYFRKDPGYYRRFENANVQTLREVVAWNRAVAKAEDLLIQDAEGIATFDELVKAYTAQNKKEKPVLPVSRQQSRTIIVDHGGSRIPSTEFFMQSDLSPLTIEQWCTLPIRPVILPTGRPERGSEGLATFLFDEILYCKEVCDRRGTQVGLSPEVRRQHIEKIRYVIEQGLPLIATEYLPMIAVANPIKRNTQQPALAEIDLIRRRVEIMKAVEMYYAPGMQWWLGNEAPAFQGPMFNLPDTYVSDFQNQIAEIMSAIDPEGNRLHIFNMADMLSGTPQRQQEWEIYRTQRLQSVKEAFFNPSHPEHLEVLAYINKFIYPMASCINPYKLEEAHGLSMEEIMQVYAKLREVTKTDFRGVDAANTTLVSQSLSSQQEALFRKLYEWGRDVTFKYRTAMDARDVLSSFREKIPPYAIAHTIITKRDKLVLYPNSGKGAFFPAHGEPVLQRSANPLQRTRVTVHPWWQIASRPENYQPFYTEGREEPLYFEEKV